MAGTDRPPGFTFLRATVMSGGFVIFGQLPVALTAANPPVCAMLLLIICTLLAAHDSVGGHDFSCLETMRFDQANQAYAYSCPRNNGIYSASYTKFYSENIKCLLDIYRLYDPAVKGDCYLLYNANEGGFIADMRLNAGAISSKANSNSKPFTYVESYTPALEKIRASYLRWVQLLRRDGIEELRQQKISPLTGTGFVWRPT